MKNVLSISNMRNSDEHTINNGVPSKELMYRAGKMIYDSYNWNGKILIVCGSGNNAGDGYVLADLLLENNNDVTLFIIKDKFSVDGKYYYDLIKDKINTIISNYNDIDFNSFDIIVDAIFGTGFNKIVDEPYKTIINKINESKSYKISIDINSGLNGDSGLTTCAIKSDLTLAIGGLKPGFYLNDGKDYVSNTKILDIGIKPIEKPYYLIEKEDIVKLFKKRENNKNKGNFGYIALIGGSIPFSGAIRLANMANSSMRAGSGVCMLAIPKTLANIIIPNILESTIYPLSDDGEFIIFKEDEFKGLINKVKSISFGMGIGNNIETKKALEYLLINYDKTLIIDADGLNALSKIDNNLLLNTKANIILTPHLKEFSRLINKDIEDIKNNLINYAIDYAKNNNLILLLKGPTTIVTDGVDTYLIKEGTPGMATAGSGDVLSGIIAAITAYNMDDLLLSTVASAYINGKAGEYAENKNSDITMLSSDTANNIKYVIEDIIKLR